MNKDGLRPSVKMQAKNSGYEYSVPLRGSRWVRGFMIFPSAGKR